MRSHLSFAMRRILAAATVFLLAGVGLGTAPSLSAEQCKVSVCGTGTATPVENGWTVKLTIRYEGSAGGAFYNLRLPGHQQMEVQGPGAHAELSLPVAAGWDGTFSVQSCVWNGTSSDCTKWETYQADFLIAEKNQQFCNVYADRAASAAIAAQQLKCGFGLESGRWSTDATAHRNWCVYQFQLAGGVSNKLVTATNLVNEAEAIATSRVDKCRADSEAATKAYSEQRAFEVKVTGKSSAQCQASNQQCEARALNYGPAAAPGYIATECAPYLRQCMANAAADAKAYADQRSSEIQVTGKTVAECQQTNFTCEARAQSFGPASAPGYIATECAPYFAQCMTNAVAALQAEAAGDSPQTPTPPQAGGGTSTCGLPGGMATVVIADPSLKTLNVRDRPQGEVITTIPEGSQVEVLGGCGVRLAAGIVAQKPGSGQAPIPGWCAIASPVGCVAEQFLVSGAPDGGTVDVGGAAGIVATKPKGQEPQSEADPQRFSVGTDVVTAPPQAGTSLARLTQGANIRNAPKGGEGTKTGSSLPAGTVVTVLECVPSWCRIGLPQVPVAWVSRGFLAFDVAGDPTPPQSFEAGEAPQPPQQQPGGGLTASTCGLAGVATVVIADPKVKILNVRDKPRGEIVSQIDEGVQVNVVGGCGAQIAAGIVAQKQGGGQGLIPGWCAISSPKVGCVAEQFLVAGIPAGGAVDTGGAAGIVANKPEAAEPSFTGTWSAEAQGLPYTISLEQSDDRVTGSYTGGDGSVGEIEGNVTGRVLRFAWRQTTDGSSGMGRFKLSGSGNSFTGSYTLGNNPDVAEGGWNGRRQ